MRSPFASALTKTPGGYIVVWRDFSTLEGGTATHRNDLTFPCGIKPYSPHAQRNKVRIIVPKLCAEFSCNFALSYFSP